jgi:hypothetical protein
MKKEKGRTQHLAGFPRGWKARNPPANGLNSTFILFPLLQSLRGIVAIVWRVRATVPAAT